MVGGWIYYRGETDGSYSTTNVKESLPDDEQWQWLMDQMPGYLKSIDRDDLLETLSIRDEWKILMAITPQERALMFSGPMPRSILQLNPYFTMIPPKQWQRKQ